MVHMIRTLSDTQEVCTDGAFRANAKHIFHAMSLDTKSMQRREQTRTVCEEYDMKNSCVTRAMAGPISVFKIILGQNKQSEDWLLSEK